MLIVLCLEKFLKMKGNLWIGGIGEVLFEINLVSRGFRLGKELLFKCVCLVKM